MGAQLASPRSGRAAILDAIRAAGSISRVELVRSPGRTGATVATTVRRLSEEGLVVETLLDQAADGRGDCRARAPGAPDELDPADRTRGPDGVQDRCPPASRGGQLCAHGALRPLDRVSLGRDLVTKSREPYRIVDELSSTN